MRAGKDETSRACTRLLLCLHDAMVLSALIQPTDSLATRSPVCEVHLRAGPAALLPPLKPTLPGGLCQVGVYEMWQDHSSSFQRIVGGTA